MSRKKVLYISYTVPPYAGAGAQANTHYLKHLREFGWEPIVLTVRPEAWERDPLRPGPSDEFLHELPPDLTIYRLPARQPFGLMRLLKRLKLLWAYHWLVRPDERLPWSLSIIPSAARIARRHGVDLIFTNTVQAWSQSLAGLALKKILKKPWVLHSEDPWTQWMMGVWPTRLHYRLEERLEARVLEEADAINMVWASYADEVAEQHPGLERSKISWIPCGYDEDDFAARLKSQRHSDGKMVVLHSGVFYHHWGASGHSGPSFLKRAYKSTVGRLLYRPYELDVQVHSPEYLMRALKRLREEQPKKGRNIEFQMTGKPDPLLERRVRQLGLADQVRQLGYLDRGDYLDALCRADVMFFPMSRFENGRRMGWLTLKLYEYLATGKPVLAATTESDAAQILRRAGVGLCVEPHDVEGLKRG